MIAQSPASDSLLTQSNEFACLRCEFIDEFARLEIAVGRCLQKLDIKFDSRKISFDQLVSKLSKVSPSPRLSKKHAADLAHLPNDCQPFQDLRASMVHGIMHIARCDEITLALFRNAADVLNNVPVYHALTQADLRERIKALARIAIRVETITSPSSPPPPKPAATAAP